MDDKERKKDGNLAGQTLLTGEDSEKKAFYLLETFVECFLEAFQQKNHEVSHDFLPPGAAERVAGPLAAILMFSPQLGGFITSVAGGFSASTLATTVAGSLTGSLGGSLGVTTPVAVLGIGGAGVAGIAGIAGIAVGAACYKLFRDKKKVNTVQETTLNLIEQVNGSIFEEVCTSEKRDLCLDSLMFLKRILVQAAVNIFINFQIQFIRACENVNPKVVLKEISVDAIGRFFNYYENKNSEMLGSQPLEIITKGVIKGKSKKTFEKTTLFDNLGVATLTSDGFPNKCYKEKGTRLERGYRLLFDWESETSYSENIDYKQVSTSIINQYHILKPKLWEEYAVKILNVIDENDPEDPDQRKKAVEALMEVITAMKEIKKLNEEIGDSGNDEKIHKRKVWFRVRDPILSFTGRTEELDKIESGIKNNKIIVIGGLPGVGKTELAVKYARTHYDENDSVAWIDASSEVTIFESFYALHYMLGWRKVEDVKSEEEFDLNEIIRNVFKSIDGDKILFIYDNAENFGLVEWCLLLQRQTKKSGIHVLLTCANLVMLKDSEIKGELEDFRLQDFTKAEAEGLIIKALQLRESDEDARVLATRLYNFPLAVMQSVFFIKEKDKALKNVNRNFTINDYLKLCNNKEKKLLNNKTFAKFMEGYNKTTFTSLKTSLHNIGWHDNEAKKVLDLMSYFAPKNIPPQIFEGEINSDDPKRWNTIIELLEQNFVIWQEKGLLNIHGLVQRVNRIELKEREEELLRKALSITDDYTNSENIDIMLPHVVSLWDCACIYKALVQNFVGDFKRSKEESIPYLHLICRGSSYDVVDIMFKSLDEDNLRRIVNISDNIKSNRTPLYYAEKNNDGRVRDLLLKKGAKERRIVFIDSSSSENRTLSILKIFAACFVESFENYYKIHYTVKNMEKSTMGMAAISTIASACEPLQKLEENVINYYNREKDVNLVPKTFNENADIVKQTFLKSSYINYYNYYKGKDNNEVAAPFLENLDILRQTFVNAAVSLFASYESQIISVCENVNCELNLEEISIDATERFLNYYKKANMVGSPSDIITKGIVHGKSKSEFKTLSVLQENKVKNISVADLFEKVGLVTLTRAGNPDNYYKKKNGSSEQGFRLLFNWESKEALLDGYERVEPLEVEKYKYVLKPELLSKYLEEILNQVYKDDSIVEFKKGDDKIVEICKTIKAIKISQREEPQKKKVWFRVRESVDGFAGRKKELKIIGEKIEDFTVLVFGSAGIGKTELAIQFARNYYNDNDSVVWINASTKHMLYDSFYELHNVLQCKSGKEKEEEELTISQIIDDVYASIGGEKILFIFDDVECEDFEMFARTRLPSNQKKIHLLITSRFRAVWGNLQVKYKFVHLEEFDEDESKEFIIERLKLNNEEYPDALELAQALYKAPLVLIQVIHYIEERKERLGSKNKNFGIKDYLKMYYSYKKEYLLNKELSKVNFEFDETILTTFNICLNNMVEQNAETKELFDLMTYLSSSSIPIDLFSKFINDDKKLSELIKLLKQYSIVRVEEDILSMHEQIQSLNKLNSKDREEEILRKILAIVADYVNLKNYEKMLPHVASIWNYAHSYIKLVQDFVENCDTADNDSIPFLHLICRGCSYEIVEDIFSKIEDNELKEILNLEDNLHSRRKPVHYVAMNGDTRLLQLLVAKGADTWYRARQKWTPLHFAVQHGNLEMVEALSEMCKINDQTEYKYTPLHLASKNGYSQIVLFLLSKGADVDASDKHKFTPLHHAVKSNNVETVKILLDKESTKQEIDVDARTELGRTPLHIASQNGYSEIVELLLQCGACVHIANNDGFTPLHYAAFYNHLDLVKLFLEERVDGLVDCVTSQGKTALDLAIEKGNLEIVQIFKEKESSFINNKFKKLEHIAVKDKRFVKRPGTTGMGPQSYEIKLIMYILLDGMIKKEKGEIESFFIASNIEEASDFDDIIYKYDYETNGHLKSKAIFLQARHKPQRTRMTKEMLLSTSRFGGDFALRKYLSSYWKIKQQLKTNKEPIFCSDINDCEFVLFTNAEYDFAAKNDVVIKVDVAEGDLLNLNTKYYYKLNAMNDQVLKVLENPLDYEMLVRELCQSVVKTKNMDFRKVVIQDFQSVLTEKIVEKVNQDEAGLRNSFLDGKPDHKFTDSFLEEVKKDEKFRNESDGVLKEDLKKIKIRVHPRFWDDAKFPRRLPLPPKELTDTDIQEFAEKLKIFTDQLNEKELTDEIKKRIQEEYGVEQQNIEFVFLDFLDKVTNWWRDDNTFLTERSTIVHDAVRKFITFEIKEPSELFVGRTEQLQSLHKYLQNDGQVLISQNSRLTEFGSVGKSELVKKYVSLYAKEYHNNVIWINADKYSTLVESFRNLADRLRIKTKNEDGNEKSVMKIVLEIYKYFAERGRNSLFIFDNAWKFETDDETDEGIDKFLPTGPNKPYVIITSRNHLNCKINKIELDVFTEQEGLEFIAKALHDFPCEEEEMKNLAKKLEYLPVALKQAVAYIKTEYERIGKSSADKFTITNYLEKYDRLAKNDFYKNVDGCTSAAFTTFSVTIHQIKERPFGMEAEEIVRILAYLSPDNIPARLFKKLISNIESLSDTSELLDQYSLVTLENGLFCIQRSLQDFIRLQLNYKESEERVLFRCLRLLSLNMGNVQNETGDSYTTHAVTAWSYAWKYDELVKSFSTFPAQIVDKLEASKRYEEANLFGSKCIETLQRVLGSNNGDFLPIMITLGTIYIKSGEYEKAMSILNDSFEKSSKILGHDHPTTIIAKRNIAITSYYLEKHEEALKKREKDCEKSEKLLSESHYNTLYNIAVEHQKIGDFHRAFKVYKEVLQKLSQEKDHDDILMVKNSIAVTLKNLGKYDEALQYYNEVLAARKRILGEDHPETLLTMHGVGVVYEDQQKFNDALEIYLEVAEKRKQKFSDEHPDVLGTENNIAGILLELGRCQEALELHQKIYEKRRATIGEDHPDTLMSLHNIGLAYEYLGDDDNALVMYQNALARRKAILGEDHIEALKTECNIAGIYSTKEDNQAALSIYQRVLPKFEATLGYYHPHTEAVRKLLNRATQAQAQDNLKAIYADFDVDLLHIALSFKDVSFVDKYLNDYRSQISNEVNKAKIRNVIDETYLRLMQERDDSGSLEIIITLLSTAIDESVDDCLCRAVNKNSFELVGYLLDKGASPNGKNKEGKTAMEISSKKLSQNPENESLQIIYGTLINMGK